MQPGFQVLKRHKAVSAEWARKFSSIPVADISDSMSRMNSGGARLRPLHAGGGVSGPALTVKTRPGDNLMIHMALNLASPGDVIVIDAGGDLNNAVIGERMLAYCIAKKFAGIIIYGAIRDYKWIRQQNFPVYACGITHQGPYKDGPGEINTPVTLGGMVVAPGDLIVGDEDGLLCIPEGAVADIYKAALAKLEYENSTFSTIGQSDNDEAKYRAKLTKLGCFFEG